MKKLTFLFIICVMFFSSFSFALPETLPEDVGSNSEIMEILKPEEEKITNYSETCLISCLAEPGTEITLYERLNDSLYVPITVDNEALTSVVGVSGIFMADITFDMNSRNDIMFYAEKDGSYQTIHKIITIKEKKDDEEMTQTIINIKNFVTEMFK